MQFVMNSTTYVFSLEVKDEKNDVKMSERKV